MPLPMNQPAPVPRTSPWWWWALPVVLAGLFHWFFLPRQAAYQNDANFYMGGAAALADGLGYRVEPYLDLPPVSQYPPLHSAYLSLFWHWGGGFPDNTPGLALAMELVALAALAFLSASLRRAGLPVWFGVLCVLLVGTSVVWLDLTTMLFSDVTFTMVGAGLIWLVGTDPGRSSRSSLWWWGLGGLLGLLWLTRSAGIAPVLGVVTLWLVNREARRVATAVALFAPLLTAFLVKKWSSGQGGTYGSYFGARIVELGGWVNYLKAQLGTAWSYADGSCWVEALFSVPSRMRYYHGTLGPLPADGLHAISVGLGFLVMALMIRGAWQRRENSLTQAALWVLFLYFGILFAWPFAIGTRAVLVTLPLTLVWLWQGISGLAPASGRGQKILWAAVAAFMGLNVIGNMEVSRRESRQFSRDAVQELAALRELAIWIRQRPGPEILVSASRDVPVNQLRHYLGRRLLANPAPEMLPGSFYDVPPALQGNRTADYAVVREGGSLTYGRRVLQVERTFGPFQLCRVGAP